MLYIGRSEVQATKVIFNTQMEEAWKGFSKGCRKTIAEECIKDTVTH